MGVVYEAEQEKPRRIVLFKVITEDVRRAATQARLQIEEFLEAGNTVD